MVAEGSVRIHGKGDRENSQQQCDNFPRSHMLTRLSAVSL